MQPLKLNGGGQKGLITKVDENGVVEGQHVAPWLEEKVLGAHHKQVPTKQELDKVSVPKEKLNPYEQYMNGV